MHGLRFRKYENSRDRQIAVFSVLYDHRSHLHPFLARRSSPSYSSLILSTNSVWQWIRSGSPLLSKWVHTSRASPSDQGGFPGRSWLNHFSVDRMFERHAQGVCNALCHKQSNARAERINRKIQEVKTIRRGHRKFENFRSAILFSAAI